MAPGRCASRRRPSSSCSSSRTPPVSTTACRACSAWPLALPYDVCVIGMAVVTCVYVVLGGLHGHGHQRLHSGHRSCCSASSPSSWRSSCNNGGFSATPLISLAQIGSAEGSAMQGPFVSFFGPDLFNLLGVVAAHLAWYLGPAPDGAEVLRHQDRRRRQAGRYHLHRLRPRGGRRLLLPRRLRALFTRARSSTPPTARPSTTPSSPPCSSTLPDVLIASW